jgi:hypothetical protein
MGLDITQVVISAVTTAIVSTFSTTTTIVLMRYFPKILDSVEKTMKSKNDQKNGKKEG